MIAEESQRYATKRLAKLKEIDNKALAPNAPLFDMPVTTNRNQPRADYPRKETTTIELNGNGHEDPERSVNIEVTVNVN